jgi:hypothetical protein
VKTCYGCWYLLQAGSDNVCLRFDHDGHMQGTVLFDDPPEPIYDDCYSTVKEPSRNAGRIHAVDKGRSASR